jgi:hypothetical protein
LPRPTLRQILFAGAFFAGATVLFTWPMAAHAGNGLGDVWDAKLNAWIFHWDFHQTFRDPVHLFDANIFYPARGALAFSENLYGAAIFGFPLFAAGFPTLTAYNLLFLLGMFLSATSAWLLAYAVTGDAFASLIAGFVYAYVPWRLAQIPHVQFQWGPFLPLLVLFLMRYLDGGRRRDAVLVGVFFAWNALSNFHYGLFSGFLLGAVLLYRLLHDGRAILRRAAGAVAAIFIAAAVIAPFFVPYVHASRTYGMERGEDEIRSFSGRPIDLLTAGPQNKLYGPLTQKLAQPEGDFFPGLGVAGIAAAGVVLARRRKSPTAGTPGEMSPGARRGVRALDLLLAILAAAWIAAKLRPGLTLGPLRLGDPGRILFFGTLTGFARLLIALPGRSRYRNLPDLLRRGPISRETGVFLAVAGTGLVVAFGMHTPYYRFLVQSFGAVFRSIRVPSRAIVLFDLGLGVLAAVGLREWRARMSRSAGALAVAGLLGVTMVEYRAFPIEISPVDPAPAAAQRWLASLPGRTAVIEWPIGPEPDVDYEFRSTTHWQPLLNGYSGFAPRGYDDLVAASNRQPQSPDVWRQIRALGGRIMVFHPHQLAGDARVSYVRGVLAGVRAGEARPLRVFDHGPERDIVFAVGDGPRGVEPEPTAAAQISEYLRHAANPPFGYIDRPAEGAVVAVGEWLFGWALDDSGIAGVSLSVDGSPEVPLSIGLVHPGVPPVHPNYPDSHHAGFGLPIPSLAPGEHDLKVIIRAKDGGVAELQRRVRAP